MTKSIDLTGVTFKDMCCDPEVVEAFADYHLFTRYCKVERARYYISQSDTYLQNRLRDARTDFNKQNVLYYGLSNNLVRIPVADTKESVDIERKLAYWINMINEINFHLQRRATLGSLFYNAQHDLREIIRSELD